MGKWTINVAILLLLSAGMALIWLLAHARYRQRMADAENAWSEIASITSGAPDVYNPDMVRDLPPVARRYFMHAIAVGTPLFIRAELSMKGKFHLGDAGSQQTFAMQARQILAPPLAFVWIAQMSMGPLRISGSDGFHKGHGWTRFWMAQSLPLVQRAATADLDRSAAIRPAIEAIWVPATLLPAHGAVWKQINPDTADVTVGFGQNATTIRLQIATDGALIKVSAQRWSDANPGKTYQMQPFGGTVDGEMTFGGFTIPGQITIGNHLGTPDYLPFFNANITSVRYF